MDQLIEVDARGARSRLAVAAAGLAAAIVMGSGLIDTLAPGPEVRLTGAELADRRQERAERQLWDGSHARWIESELRLRSRVRQTLSPPWIATLLMHAGVGDPSIIVGQDHWLFLRNRARPSDLEASEAPATASHTLAAIRRRLAAHGSQLLTVAVPRKVVTCASKLPSGFDPRPEVDTETLGAVRAAGTAILDVADAWRELPPEDCFLQLDTHWTTAAQRALARAIAGDPSTAWIVPGDVPLERTVRAQDVQLLKYMGLDPYGPVAGRFDLPPVERFELASPDAESPTKDVALVGSSYTASYDLTALLSSELGVVVEETAIAGAALSDPLVRLVAVRQLEGAPLPRLVIFEFPIHQILELPRRSRNVSLALAQFFLRLEPANPMPLSESRASAAWAASELASSGDGALLLEIEVESQAATRWRLNTSGLHLAFKLKPGMHRIWLPIIDGSAGSNGASLSPLDKNASAARVTSRLAIDARETIPWELAPQPASGHPVAANDALVIRLLAAPQGPASFTLRGTARSGADVTVTHAFPSAIHGPVVLTLPEFEGGQLLGIEADGAALDSIFGAHL